MDHHPVTSSSIASVGYADGVLEVRFLSGLHYRYAGVPVETFEALQAAPSIGAHFARHIRGQFPHTKVEPEEAAS